MNTRLQGQNVSYVEVLPFVSISVKGPVARSVVGAPSAFISANDVSARNVAVDQFVSIIA